MAIVNRLLDVFFRALDAVDVVRERVDRVLGRAPTPEPWATEWSPVPPPCSDDRRREAKPQDGEARAGRTEPTAPKEQRDERAQQHVKKGAHKNGNAKPKPVTKKGGASRKGSVDRKGSEFDSPRARAIIEHLRSEGGSVITEDAMHDGKKVLARVLWALSASEQAGSALGLTAADTSALLASAAGLEVFATNVARTCRDESHLIEESQPDGRSKRYKLTDAGRKAAAALSTRPIA